MGSRARASCRFGRAGISSAAAILAVAIASPALAAPQDATKPAEPPAVKPSLRSRPLSQPPIIDGVLDEDAWREGPVETGEWLKEEAP